MLTTDLSMTRQTPPLNATGKQPVNYTDLKKKVVRTVFIKNIKISIKTWRGSVLIFGNIKLLCPEDILQISNYENNLSRVLESIQTFGATHGI